MTTVQECPEILRFDPGKGEKGTLLVNLAMPVANEYFTLAAGIVECANECGWRITIYVRDRATIDAHLEPLRRWVAQGHEIGIALSGPNGNVSDALIEEAHVEPTTGRYETANRIAPLFADAGLVRMISYLKAAIRDRLQVDAHSLHYIATPDAMVSVLQQTGITGLNVLCPQQKFFQADLFSGTDLWLPFALDVAAPSFKSPAQCPVGERTIVDCLWTTRDLLGTYYYHCSPHSTHPLDLLRGGEDGLQYEYPHFTFDTIAENSEWNLFGYIQFMMEMWIDLEGDLAGYCAMFKELMRYVARLSGKYHVVNMTTNEIRELYRENQWTAPPVAEIWTEFPRIAEVNAGYAQPSSPGGDAPLFLVAGQHGRYVFSRSGKFFAPLERFGYKRQTAAIWNPAVRAAHTDNGSGQTCLSACSVRAPNLPVEIDDFTAGVVASNDIDYQFVRKLPEHPYVELRRELWLAPGEARQILIARHRADREDYSRFGLVFWDTIPSRETLSSLAHGQSATFMAVDVRKEWRVDRLAVDVSESIEVVRQGRNRYRIRNRLSAPFQFEAIFLQLDQDVELAAQTVTINGAEVASSVDPEGRWVCFWGRIPAQGHDLRLVIG